VELKQDYQSKTEKNKQRAAALQEILDDEKSANKYMRESLQILNTFADSPVLTSEHIDRFINRVIIHKEGRIHVDFGNMTSNAKSSVWNEYKSWYNV
jgi:hypothetical protein